MLHFDLKEMFYILYFQSRKTNKYYFNIKKIIKEIIRLYLFGITNKLV